MKNEKHITGRTAWDVLSEVISSRIFWWLTGGILVICLLLVAWVHSQTAPGHSVQLFGVPFYIKAPSSASFGSSVSSVSPKSSGKVPRKSILSSEVPGCEEPSQVLDVTSTEEMKVRGDKIFLPEEDAKIQRFMDNGDGTISDNIAGVLLLKNANCFHGQNWDYAMSRARNLANGICGLMDGSLPRDWRLPTKNELRILIECRKSGLASNIQTGRYWSSTNNPINSGNAYYIDLSKDSIMNKDKSFEYFVWPIRKK